MTQRNDSVPYWIESKLFENVLHETIDDFSEVLSFKAFRALAPGENYATVMLKIEIEVLLKNGSTHRQSFMLKVPHDSKIYRDKMMQFNLFCTEGGMYQEILPELEDIYNKIGLKVKFGAKSFRLPIDKEYILLENLSDKGFRNAPRQDCLDMQHCKSVLKKLALWHAASAVRIEQMGPYQHKYAKDIFIETGKGVLRTMLESSFKHWFNTVRKLPNQNEFLPVLEEIKNNVADLFHSQSSTANNEFRVLNHGDCWSNNIMFQYDGAGKLLETYFVDFQIPSYNSPAQDLLYFIISSAQVDIKINKFDYMIKYYYDNLIEHLKLLKYGKPLPTLKELNISLIRHGQWAFFAALITLGAVLCDRTDQASVDNLTGDCEEADRFKEMMYTNQRYIKHLEVILPWLCYRGVFQLPA